MDRQAVITAVLADRCVRDFDDDLRRNGRSCEQMTSFGIEVAEVVGELVRKHGACASEVVSAMMGIIHGVGEACAEERELEEAADRVADDLRRGAEERRRAAS